MASLGTWEWWRSRRRDYNRWLVISGISAFITYAVLIFSFPKAIPDTEITAFTTLFQIILYLLLVALANLFFFLGPLSELLLKPMDTERFRKMTYSTGKWFSVALPFSAPIIILFKMVRI